MENQVQSRQDRDTTTLYDLMNVVLHSNNSTADKIKLIDELRKNNPGTSDRWTYRWAVWLLCAILFVIILSIFLIAKEDIKIPDSLIAIGSTIAGGIVGVLSPSRNTSSNNKQ